MRMPGRGFSRGSSAKGRDAWILLIGIFKLIKGAGLVIVGIGLLRLLHRDIALTVTHWVEVLRLDPDNQHIHRAISTIFRVTPAQLRGLSAGTFLYAGLFITEGAGLVKRKHWAEYLALISTALFIPLEIYELAHRFTWVRVAVLIINLLIVWYLAVRLRRR